MKGFIVRSRLIRGKSHEENPELSQEKSCKCVETIYLPSRTDDEIVQTTTRKWSWQHGVVGDCCSAGSNPARAVVPKNKLSSGQYKYTWGMCSYGETLYLKENFIGRVIVLGKPKNDKPRPGGS